MVLLAFVLFFTNIEIIASIIVRTIKLSYNKMMKNICFLTVLLSFSAATFASALAQAKIHNKNNELMGVTKQEQQQAKNASSSIEVTLLIEQSYPPYSYVDDNELKGLLVDIVSTIDKKLEGFTIKLIPSTWPVAKSKIRNGEQLGLVGPYLNVDIWPYMYPYSATILYEKVITVCHENEMLDRSKGQPREWPDSYANLTIGTVAGYDGWHGDYRNSNVNTMRFFEYPNTDVALMAVYKEFVPCTIFEKATYQHTIKQLLRDKRIKEDHNLAIAQVLAQKSVHIGYSEKAFQSGNYPHAYEFQKAFDTELVKILNSGQFDALFESYGVEYK